MIHIDGERVIAVISGRPRPQPRPRFCRGRVVAVADANAKEWIRLVEAELKRAVVAAPSVGGPVRVSLTFLLSVKDAKKWGKAHEAVPDTDNLAKLVMDCAQRVGLIPEDQRVVDLSVRKIYSREDGAVVEVEPHIGSHGGDVLGRAPDMAAVAALLSSGIRA